MSLFIFHKDSFHSPESECDFNFTSRKGHDISSIVS